MPLKFLGRHPALALHDIKQGLNPKKQGRLRGLKDGARPEAELPPTAFARTNFGSSPNPITLLSVTVGTDKVFALKAAAPQQGPGVRFRGDFGKKAFGWK
jgi:hypothetical protein